MRVAVLLAAGLAACSAGSHDAPADIFLGALAQHCGKAFEGRLVSTDEADRDFAGKRLVMEVRECAPTEIRIPFHVGEDRSRTLVVTRTETGLRLKHDHRHEDGSPDELTNYGGDTVAAGSASRQEFPADQFSKDLFLDEGRAVSVDNVWAVEITDASFAYELRRPNRHFRVEFDLTKPVAPPPPPWGAAAAR
ncbi:MAG: hypothetical protein HXY23_07485 [Parvularculaceae bacterium]|nr:hypothetical protein [Parvularculaceae bacterium]